MANALGVDEAILDGMVTTADETGRPQFYDLLRHTRSPVYVAFDLIWVDGETCAPAARRAPEATPGHSAEGIAARLRAAVRHRQRPGTVVRAHDLEGIVAKRLKDPYDPRARRLKIKKPGLFAEGRQARVVR